MAGHAKYHAGYSQVPFPKIPAGQRYLGKVLGGALWFWVLYRVREVSIIITGDHGRNLY